MKQFLLKSALSLSILIPLTFLASCSSDDDNNSPGAGSGDNINLTTSALLGIWEITAATSDVWSEDSGTVIHDDVEDTEMLGSLAEFSSTDISLLGAPEDIVMNYIIDNVANTISIEDEDSPGEYDVYVVTTLTSTTIVMSNAAPQAGDYAPDGDDYPTDGNVYEQESITLTKYVDTIDLTASAILGLWEITSATSDIWSDISGTVAHNDIEDSEIIGALSEFSSTNLALHEGSEPFTMDYIIDDVFNTISFEDEENPGQYNVFYVTTLNSTTIVMSNAEPETEDYEADSDYPSDGNVYEQQSLTLTKFVDTISLTTGAIVGDWEVTDATIDVWGETDGDVIYDDVSNTDMINQVIEITNSSIIAGPDTMPYTLNDTLNFITLQVEESPAKYEIYKVTVLNSTTIVMSNLPPNDEAYEDDSDYPLDGKIYRQQTITLTKQ